jgi:hypothetical protein
VKRISVGAAGNFIGDIQSAGDYFLKVQPSFNMDQAGLTNSYYQNVWEWANALTVNFVCKDTNQVNLQILGYNQTSGGQGVIAGNLRYDITNEPLAAADVYLQNDITNEPLMLVKTNSIGEYSFSGIPIGSYKITCEVTGLPQVTTHHLTITTDKFYFTYVNFVADSSFNNGSYGFGVYKDTATTISVPENLISSNVFHVYPSPFKDYLKVTGNASARGQYWISITNEAGQQVYKALIKLGLNQSLDYIINTSELTPGLYYLTLISENGKWVKKVIKK